MSDYTLFLERDEKELLVDWDWDLIKEVRKFDKLWKQGVPIDEIAATLDRPLLSVQLLKLDRLLRGRIKERPFGDYGTVEKYLAAFGEAVQLNVIDCKKKRDKKYAQN